MKWYQIVYEGKTNFGGHVSRETFVTGKMRKDELEMVIHYLNNGVYLPLISRTIEVRKQFGNEFTFEEVYPETAKVIEVDLT